MIVKRFYLLAISLLFVYLTISFAVAQTCLDLALPFVQLKTIYTLTIEKGSYADRYPLLTKDLFDLYFNIPSDKSLLEGDHLITKMDAFRYVIFHKKEIAQKLREIAESSDDEILNTALIKSANKIDISLGRESKLLKKVEETDGHELFFDEQEPLRSETNIQYYRGETAVLYGELGELMYMSTIKGPELKGTYTWHLFDGLLPPTTVRLTHKFHHNLPKLLVVFKAYVEALGNNFNEEIMSSFLNKELDVIRGNHREWIEVKNLKNIVTIRSLQHEHSGVYKQADKLHQAITMLGLQDKIKLKQTFINCIEEKAALLFEEKFGIEVVGCIR